MRSAPFMFTVPKRTVPPSARNSICAPVFVRGWNVWLPYDPARIRELKAGGDGPIQVAGSRTLLQALIVDGLLDELRLQVFPVLLGSGDRLFPDSPDKRPLRLTQHRVLATGVQLQHFVPA